MTIVYSEIKNGINFLASCNFNSRIPVKLNPFVMEPPTIVSIDTDPTVESRTYGGLARLSSLSLSSNCDAFH